ncbi:hypothetical protein EMCRGX_G016524 [Ephydatia muelleri]
MRVAGAVKKAGAALGAALGGASAGVTLQAVGPALLQAVAALLLAVAEGPALLQAVAGLLLAVAVGPALLQAVAGLLLAVPVGPALLQAAAAAAALLLAVAVGPALLQAVAALLLAVAVGPALLQAVAGLLLAVPVGPALLLAVAALLLAVAVGPALLQAVAGLLLAVPVGPALLQAAAALLLVVADLGHPRQRSIYTGDEDKDDQRLCVVEHKAIRCLCQGLVQQHCRRLRPTWQLESFMKGHHLNCHLESRCCQPGYHPKRLCCRDTFWMESFNHQLLTYLPKRIHFHTNTFKMWMNLAVIDWNENTQRASTSHGEYLDVRRPDHHSTYNVLKKKTFQFVRNIWNAYILKNISSLHSFEEEDDAIDELMSPDDSTLLDGEYVDSESEEYQEDNDNDA